DGVFYSLALTFGTLLSSQGTDASFVLTLSGFAPGASLLCFTLYQEFFRSLTALFSIRTHKRHTDTQQRIQDWITSEGCCPHLASS
ncbi:hypothetical protein ACFY97_34095, partial [Streptomyces klenkii]|uniref:hypothetical protein n=1 Tax=Streptomyces klenkii TaxID=1420899 RepID=UPI0036E5CD3A